jgi:hypothetical protein
LTGQDARQQRGNARADQLKNRDNRAISRMPRPAEQASPAIAPADSTDVAAPPVAAFTPRPGLASRAITPAPAVTPEDVLDAPREATPFPKKLLSPTPLPTAAAAATTAPRLTPPVITAPAPAQGEPATEATPVTTRTTTRLSDIDTDAATSPTPSPTPNARKKPKDDAEPSEDTDVADSPDATPDN